MLPGMTPTPGARFDDLLSSRARIGWDAPAPPSRPVIDALYDFGAGYPDPVTYPYDALVDATARMMKEEGGDALNYGEYQGYTGLREVVCHKYALFERLEVTPENLIVSNGSGHALSLAMSGFVDIGDAIISEAPTFSGTLHTIRRHGPEVLDVPVDAEGMVTSVAREHLERLKRQGRRCKLIYTIVNFQNPAGPTLSLARREELVALAHEYDTLILDDGFRLGWLCAPREMIPVFQGFLFGGGVNPFASRVATYYLRDHMAEHVAVLVGAYRAKRDAMLKALWEVLGRTDVEISRPEGGFFIWIKLPTGTDPKRLRDIASSLRVQYSPGPAFFPNGGGERFIRLAYSYESPERCYEGARLLAQAILDAKS